MHRSRRAILLLLLPAACGGPEPVAQAYPPPRYDYLPQIRLSVADIDIDDSWSPRGAGRHVEAIAPVTPRDALRRMAQDRLFAAGGPGRAVLVIEDASLVRRVDQYVANFAVRVDLADGGGTLLTSAVARAAGSRAIAGDSENAARADLYGLVDEVMREMNVELEFQLRRALRTAPEATSPISPRAEPVQTETLEGPPKPEPQTPD